MAIAVQGSITITRKNGRKGQFNVGHLVTEIGEFEVKDSLIEEFDEGAYKGTFLIQWIEPDSFAWRGSVFVKNKATLAEIIVDEEDETPEPTALTPPVIDPIDEKTSAAPAPAPAPKPADATAQPDAKPGRATAPPTAPTPEALFSEELQQAIMRREPVKLDPTIDRQVFRNQRDALRQIGYAFDSKSQIWMPPAEKVDDGELVF